MLRKCSFWGQRWPFYYWETHYSDTQYTCRYLDRGAQPDSIHNIFLCSLTFYMHNLYVIARVLTWKFFFQSYCSPCRFWGVRHCFYYDSRHSGNRIRIIHELQNTHSKVSYILSFYNCKIWPLRFFINSFDKYIFKFKLDILFFYITLLTFYSGIYLCLFIVCLFYSVNFFYLNRSMFF